MEQQDDTSLSSNSASDALVPVGKTEVVRTALSEPGSQDAFWPEPMASEAEPLSRSFKRLLWRKWLILGVFALVAAISISLIWVLVQPRYKSVAVVRVSPVVQRIVFRTENSGSVPLYRSYLNTQVSIIRSPTVLNRVLDRSDVQNTSWYKGDGKSLMKDAPMPIERLGEDLVVSPRRDTELIDVSMSTLNRGDAKLIVDAIVEEYKDLIDETRQAMGAGVTQTVSKKCEQLASEVKGLVEIRDNLSLQIGTLDSIELRSQLSTQLSDLESQQAQLLRAFEVTKWEFDRLAREEERRKELEAKGGASGESEEAVTDESDRRYSIDAEWRKLHINMENARHELKLARMQFGDSHIKIKMLNSGVDHAQRLLEEREGQLERQWAHLPAEVADGTGDNMGPQGRKALEQVLKKQEKMIAVLNRQIEDKHARIQQVGEVAKRIGQYEEELKHKRTVYDEVRDRKKVLEMEAEAPARVTIAAYGLQHSKPAQDRRVVLTVMAFGGAMMFALAVGYLRNSLDERIHEVDEVQHTVHVPFLGQLPELPAIQLPPELGGQAQEGTLASVDELALSGCPSVGDIGRNALMERARMLRTSLLERVQGKEEKVVLITSAKPRSGKTAVAVLLAKSLAALGKKVLLLEADFRRPVLGDRLGLGSEVGLASLLCGKAVESEVIGKADSVCFDVAVAGSLPMEFDAELLANGVFSSSLRRWKKFYDFIIVDSPPMLPVADARILAKHVDGIIMVLRSSHDRKSEAIEAYAKLSTTGRRLLGTVLVGGQFGQDRRYGYGYSYGYSYHRRNDAGQDKSGSDESVVRSPTYVEAG